MKVCQISQSNRLMDLQQSLKAVVLYLKLVAVRMVSLQVILKIDFQQNDNPQIWKTVPANTKDKKLIFLVGLEWNLPEIKAFKYCISVISSGYTRNNLLVLLYQDCVDGNLVQS